MDRRALIEAMTWRLESAARAADVLRAALLDRGETVSPLVLARLAIEVDQLAGGLEALARFRSEPNEERKQRSC